MKVLIVTGSRADYGLLEWPIKVFSEAFEVEIARVWNNSFDLSFTEIEHRLENRPDLMLVLGDRFEILGAVTAAHLARVPVAHIGGGDVTEGSYDDAMRDCISRMASIHFVTSSSAMARLTHMGLKNVHLVGNPGIDYIKHANWKTERPIAQPYVVVSYQAETIDGTNEIGLALETVGQRYAVLISPNTDRGSAAIGKVLEDFPGPSTVYQVLPHGEFLNLIFHCEEFIGNSSSMLYEAPELGVKTRMIGKRQKGRTIPWGDGNASKRMVKVIQYGSY